MIKLKRISDFDRDKLRQYYLRHLSIPLWQSHKRKIATVYRQLPQNNLKLTFIYLNHDVMVDDVVVLLKNVGAFYDLKALEIGYVIFNGSAAGEVELGTLPSHGMAILLYSNAFTRQAKAIRGRFNELFELKLPNFNDSDAYAFNNKDIKKALMDMRHKIDPCV